MTQFKEHQKQNDGSHEIEVEVNFADTTKNESCSYYYFKDTDSIQIIYWNEHYGDEQKFLKTHKFNSFKEYAENNDSLISATNNWDYEKESVFQTYSDISFEEWIYEDEGRDCLIEFIDFQLQIHGTQYVKRNIFQRVARWYNEKMYNLKNN
tara:strand:+ start:79 stop:534 length:456 start_codon:yes stop_codon:yes gene_type:complete